jgi:hypothetical protein
MTVLSFVSLNIRYKNNTYFPINYLLDFLHHQRGAQGSDSSTFHAKYFCLISDIYVKKNQKTFEIVYSYTNKSAYITVFHKIDDLRFRGGRV